MIRSLLTASLCCVFLTPAAAQDPVYTDQTSASGLGGVYFNPGTYSHQNYTGPIGCGDFDRDGDQDLFLPSAGGDGIPDRLFINDGNGNFTEQAAAWGLTEVHKGKGIAVGDFDGNGWLDVYLTSAGPGVLAQAGQHRLYKNTGMGTFVNVATAAGVNQTTASEDGFGCCFGDYDLDGDLDLFVAGFASNNSGNRLFQNNGDETFTDVTSAIGLFSGVSGASGFAPRFQDMNGDRYPELLLVADFGSSHYFTNDGDGTFTESNTASGVAQEENGMGQTVGDYNNDGLIDWYVTSIYRPAINWTGNKLYLNQGSNSFLEVAGTAGIDDGGYGWGAISIDIDHDRWLDIVETNGASGEFFGEQSYLFHSNGSAGTYDEIATVAGLVHTGFGRGILNFDSDGDGDQDIVISGNYEPLRLFRNDTPAGGRHWLRVFLDRGGQTTIAPDGIGAAVRVTTLSGTLHRWIDAGDNFLSKSELSAHFGLGTDPNVLDLRVVWPDGAEQIVTGVGIDQTITVVRAGATALVRGDVNADLAVDISDPVSLLQGLFSSIAFPCEEAGDVNGDGLLDIADAVYLLAFIFGGGPFPVPPYPNCDLAPGVFPCLDPACP